MGRVYVERLSGSEVYACNSCGAHITRNKDVLCKVRINPEIESE